MALTMIQIRELLYSSMIDKLSEIEPGLQLLQSVPASKSSLPGVYIEIKKCHGKSAGIGGFIGYKTTDDDTLSGEIYGKQYDVEASIDFWLESNNDDVLPKLHLLTEKMHEVFIDSNNTLSEWNICSAEIVSVGRIEFNVLTGVLPSMANVLRRTIETSLVFEIDEIKEYEIIDTIEIESRLQ